MKCTSLLVCVLTLFYTNIHTSALESLSLDDSANSELSAKRIKSDQDKKPIIHVSVSRAAALGMLTLGQKAAYWTPIFQKESFARGARLAQLYKSTQKDNLATEEILNAKELVHFGKSLTGPEKEAFTRGFNSTSDTSANAEVTSVFCCSMGSETITPNLAQLFPAMTRLELYAYWKASLECKDDAQFPPALTELYVYAQEGGSLTIDSTLPATLTRLVLSCKTKGAITITKTLPQGVRVSMQGDGTGFVQYRM